MTTEDEDQSVLKHIDRLVNEEERLYGRSELTDADRVRLLGTSCCGQLRTPHVAGNNRDG
jgi:hypothetical protein